jgi:hypothetical protein
MANWYDDKADHPPWIKALAEVRLMAAREGHCYQHVQAIIVAIDQYAEAALGNRTFFLNSQQRVGRSPLGKRLDPSAAFGGKLKQPFDRQAVEGAKRSRG